MARQLALIAIASVLLLTTPAPSSAKASDAPILAKNGGVYSVGDRLTGPCYRKDTNWAYTEFAATKPYRRIGIGDDANWYVDPPEYYNDYKGCIPFKLRHPGSYRFSTEQGQDPPATEHSETVARGSFKVGVLRANAGKPQSVERGGTAQLDGSKSSPRRKIKSYRWKYTLGKGCPRGAEAADDAGSDKVNPTFVALCRVRATLTVRDSKGKEARDTTIVTVAPRSSPVWHTAYSFETETRRFLRQFKPLTTDSKTDIAGALRCPNGWDIRPFCTIGTFGEGSEYELAGRVVDHDGPFNGWYYIRTPKLPPAKLVAFLNPYLEPHGPAPPYVARRGTAPTMSNPNWYRHNADHGVDVERQRSFTIGHEGYGLGVPRSGHLQALVEAISANDNHNDPRRYLESRVGPTKRGLEQRTDSCLEKIEDEVFKYMSDPLSAKAWILANAFVWDPGFFGFLGGWVAADLGSLHTPPSRPVPIPVVGCAHRR